MLRTRFRERFGIDAPIVVAPMGPDLTGVERLPRSAVPAASASSKRSSVRRNDCARKFGACVR
jgi:hypothetical protein